MKWNCVQQLLYFALLKFTIESKRIKQVGVNLPKETKDLYSKNFKLLMEETEDDTNRWKDIACSQLGRIKTVKMSTLPKAKRHLKRCTIMLIIREIHIKTPMGYHFILVRSAIIEMSINNTCWKGCRKKRYLLDCRWECKLVQSLWRTVWRFLKKLKVKILYDL